MTKHQLYIGIIATIVIVGGCKQPALPHMKLTVKDSVHVHVPVPVKMTYKADQYSTTATGTIERRGGMSLKYEKYSYKIELDGAVSLAGMQSDDDWIIHASAIDKTFMRNVVSYEIFNEMSDNNVAVNSSYMYLFINDEFQGLYILMEQLESTRLGIDKKDSFACVFKEPPVFRSDSIVPQDADNYFQQSYPNKVNDYGLAAMQSMRDSLLYAPDSAIKYWSRRVFDWNNIADWHILLLLTNNGDGVVKNFYLYKKNSNTPFRIAPWDYDHSYGRDGDNEYNMLQTLVDPERNLLIKRLMQQSEYRKLVQDRWNELREKGIIDEAHLLGILQKKADVIKGAIRKNRELWPDDNWWYYDANSFDEEVQIMEEYIAIRIPQLDIWFSSL